MVERYWARQIPDDVAKRAQVVFATDYDTLDRSMRESWKSEQRLAARIRELEAIAEVASMIDVLWGTDDGDGGMDDAEFCEAIDKLRVVLRPWRRLRAAGSPSDGEEP